MEDDLQSTNSMMVISSTHESYDERQRKRDEKATPTWIIILKRTCRASGETATDTRPKWHIMKPNPNRPAGDPKMYTVS